MRATISLLLVIAAGCGSGRSGVAVPDEAPDRDALSDECQAALEAQPSDQYCTVRCSRCSADLQPCRTRCLLGEVDATDEELAAATTCWSEAQDCSEETRAMCGDLEALLDLANVIEACAEDIARRS